MKFYLTSLNPIFNTNIRLILFYFGTFLTDSTEILGTKLWLKSQVEAPFEEFDVHSHPFSILQMDEHPSPFNVFPSSHI